MQVTTHRQQYQAKTNFQGFRTKDARALVALDLDGTLAHGTNEDVQKVLQLAQRANATLCYATGRTHKEFDKLQEEKRGKGIHIPTPQHLVANNGQFIYQNINGELVEDLNWRNIIVKKTGFDRSTVFKTMYKIAHRPEYVHSPKEIETLKTFEDPRLKGFGKRVEEDPLFWDSQISYYEWNTSAHLLEFLVGHKIPIPEFKKTIKTELASQGIRGKLIVHEYDKETMDACPDSILRKSRPLKESPEGSMKALFVCAAEKSDGVKYLGQKLDIPNEEILTAGNDINDLSLASFAKKGSFFVCVGNAVRELVEHAQNTRTQTIIFAQEHGAKGIAEGMEKVLAQFRKD